jgi:hypothetical protein
VAAVGYVAISFIQPGLALKPALRFQAVSSIPLIIGAFLLTTLGLSSSQGKWIGFQFLGAYFVGYGVLTPSTILSIYPIGMGFNAAHTAISFAEGIGGAVGIATAQSVFLNTLKLGLEGAGVQPSIIFANGATTLKGILMQETTKRAFEVYDTALTHTFYVPAGSTCLALLSLSLLPLAAKYRKEGKSLSSFLPVVFVILVCSGFLAGLGVGIWALATKAPKNIQIGGGLAIGILILAIPSVMMVFLHRYRMRMPLRVPLELSE